MGLLPRVAGSIVLNGKSLKELPVERRIFRASATCRKSATSSAPLTVMENLRVVEAVDDRKAMIDRMLTLFPVLAERRRTQAENLSGGGASNWPSPGR